MLQRLTLLTLILLALLLPFELEQPWLALGPLVLTNVEVLLWLALGLGLLAWWQLGRPALPLPRPLAAAALLWLGLLFTSALLAPDFQANAFKAAVRTAFGVLLALVVFDNVRRPGALRWLAAALLAGGLVASGIGLAELAAGVDLGWLARFRISPTVVGPFLRLSGPFDYANQAAMFFEATLPLLLAFAWLAWRRERQRLLLLLLPLALLYLQAAILTFSRSSFATLLLVHLGLALLLVPGQIASALVPQRKARQASTTGTGSSERSGWLASSPERRGTLAALSGVLALLTLFLIAANSLLNPVFRLRFSSESDNDWYLARFVAPAELELTAGQEQIVTVQVTNDGVFTWRTAGSRPINLAARWVQPESGRELSQRPRWPLPQPVAPDDTVTVEVPLRAPQTTGDYRLVWDMVQEHVIWFGAKTGQEAASVVTVRPALSGSEADRAAATASGDFFEEAWNYRAPVPGRLMLWRAAVTLWQERPLLGVGLDNFRLLYGRPLGYAAWNTTIHTNNWYIETVVSQGLLGTLAFVLWLGLLLLDVVRRLRRPEAAVWQWALAAGLLAYAVHGLLDYFLLFNATGLLFWMLVGLWLAATRGIPAQETSG